MKMSAYGRTDIDDEIKGGRPGLPLSPVIPAPEPEPTGPQSPPNCRRALTCPRNTDTFTLYTVIRHSPGISAMRRVDNPLFICHNVSN